MAVAELDLGGQQALVSAFSPDLELQRVSEARLLLWGNALSLVGLASLESHEGDLQLPDALRRPELVAARAAPLLVDLIQLLL